MKEEKSYLIFKNDEPQIFTVPQGYILLSIEKRAYTDELAEITITFDHKFKKYYHQIFAPFTYGITNETSPALETKFIAESCDILLTITAKSILKELDVALVFSMTKIENYPLLSLIEFIDSIDGQPPSIPRFSQGITYYLF